MIVLLWSRCRNRSYSVFWSLLLITSAMSIKRLMSRCVITWPDVITNANPIPEIPTHSHPYLFVLICNLLLRKVSLRRKEKSSSLLSNFLEVMGSFLEKRHGLIPNLMEMLLKNLFANIWTLPFTFFTRTRREGINRIKYEGSQHQRRDVYGGGSRGGARGGCPTYFLTTLRPKGWKKFFFLRPPPPLFISGSGWPGYPVISRCGSTGVGVTKPLSQRRSWDVLVPKSVMFRVFKNKQLSPA